MIILRVGCTSMVHANSRGPFELGEFPITLGIMIGLITGTINCKFCDLGQSRNTFTPEYIIILFHKRNFEFSIN